MSAFARLGAVLLLATTAAAPLRDVPLREVTVDDPFWSPKRDVWRRVTITDCLDKFDRDGAMANFDHVARGELTAGHGGAPWFDGLVYEMIRAAADFLAERPDAALEARVDADVARIAAAAAADPGGYVNTYTQLKEPTHRWGLDGGNDLYQHDLYNAGCLVDAGVHYYRATGKADLLAVGVRLANTMAGTMGPPPRRNVIPGHAIGEAAMVGLYHLCREQPALAAKLSARPDDYLALAKFWIDARGHHQGRTDFKAYDQDAVPLAEQTSIEGHAVRAPLFVDGVTVAGMAASDGQYLTHARRLWASMVGRRMYVTGGVGSFADEERFGPDHVLPNDAYAETCAAVANGFLSHDLNLATGDAAAADEVERAAYNGALAGVSVAGNAYTYVNPLVAGRGRARWAWHGCPCCPPMFLKLMSALPGYVYATDAAGVTVNLYVGSRATADVAGAPVRLTQTTRYPWAGDVRLAVDPARPATFDVRLRVPGWCRGGPSTGGLYATAVGGPDAFTVTVNGRPVPADVTAGYATIRREWRAGDAVEVRMAMPVRRVTADARVAADRGRVTLMRGPLVYCVESADNGGRVSDLFLPDDAAVTTEDRPDLLGGVTVLHAAARRRAVGGGADAAADATFVPFYANANRGPVEMAVWVPTSAADAKTPTTEGAAVPSASHCFAEDSVYGMNDGKAPRRSSQAVQPRFSWWDHKGSAEWAQYTFDQPRTVSAVDVYWFADSGTGGGCALPESWRLTYLAGDGTWQPVPGRPEFGTAADAFNTARFDAVTTTGLRVEARLRPGQSAGILQWRVRP